MGQEQSVDIETDTPSFRFNRLIGDTEPKDLQAALGTHLCALDARVTQPRKRSSYM